jgi:hypothetical protein
VPGIVLGFALTFVSAVTGFHTSFLFQLAALLVGLNVLNLLPVHPLDGGRIVHALVTAGRPRVSIVMRGLATAVFVAAAIGLREPMTALLAAFSGYALWQEVKRARIEGAIRRTPGFAETTSAEERRRFIFESLKGRPEGAPAQWLATVRALEVPLSHTRPGRLSALMVGLIYVGLFVAAWLGIGRLGSSMLNHMHCPSTSGATALSCEDPTLPASAWSNLPRPASTRPAGLASEDPPFGVAAFAWCDFPDWSTAKGLYLRLNDAASNGARYCTALPWEKTDDGVSEAVHLRARSTLAALRRATLDPEDRDVAAVDAAIARAQKEGDFDAELARMYRAAIADARTTTPEAERIVGDRLGRSPTRSCDRIRLANVALVSPGEETKPAARTAASKPVEPSTVRFSVRLAKREDFAPLGKYLCEVGCRVQVLPIAANDVRAEICF